MMPIRYTTVDITDAIKSMFKVYPHLQSIILRRNMNTYIHRRPVWPAGQKDVCDPTTVTIDERSNTGYQFPLYARQYITNIITELRNNISMKNNNAAVTISDITIQPLDEDRDRAQNNFSITTLSRDMLNAPADRMICILVRFQLIKNNDVHTI